MHKKLSYQELRNRVKGLEEEILSRTGIEAAFLEFERKWRSLLEEQTARLKKEIADRRQTRRMVG